LDHGCRGDGRPWCKQTKLRVCRPDNLRCSREPFCRRSRQTLRVANTSRTASCRCRAEVQSQSGPWQRRRSDDARLPTTLQHQPAAEETSWDEPHRAGDSRGQIQQLIDERLRSRVSSNDCRFLRRPAIEKERLGVRQLLNCRSAQQQ